MLRPVARSSKKEGQDVRDVRRIEIKLEMLVQDARPPRNGSLTSSRLGRVLIVGRDPLASRVRELVPPPPFARPASSVERGRALGQPQVAVCCCDGGAETHSLLRRRRGRGSAVVLAGHERPCDLCTEALARGAFLWIPESLLELQLGPALGYLLSASRTNELGGARADATSETATVAGRQYPLRSADHRLLRYLVEREGHWQSEAELLRDVFETRSSRETSLVRVHVLTLRRSLGTAGRCIQSKRGSGYRFVSL